MMTISTKFTINPGSTSEEIITAILRSRGYTTKSEIESFLHPPELKLPYILKETGIKKSNLTKIQKILDFHLSANHDISVFGDYDADGVTATAIMWQVISAYAKKSDSHARILPFIPDRHKHGYGLSDKAVAEVVTGSAFANTQFEGFSPKLIITVDTGIVAHAGIKKFIDNGINMIITDHHQPLPTLPKATGILHTLVTSGAGLAWIFSLAILGVPAMRLLDLAVIGVVGDMMPLTGLNRAICVAGLHALTTTKRPGLLSMKAAMGVGEKSMTTYDISFGIAPRINAAGRIYNPKDALRLLCTSDQKLAKDLAEKIESHNKDRQEYTDTALKHATNLKNVHNIIVILGDYHEGVIGLVAGKLTEIFHRPAIVMSDNGEIIKGSARSIPGVNITDLLRSLKTPFEGIGGHDQAAGFSLLKKDVKKITKEIEEIGDKQISANLLVKSHSADVEIPLKLTSLKLVKLLHTLEPYGMSNQKPKFLLHDLNVIEDRKLGADGKHRKLTIEQSGVTRELMLFNAKETYPLTHLKSLICTIDLNVWRDKETLQLIASYVEI